MSLTSFRCVSLSSLAASPQVPGPSRNCGARGLGRLCAALSCLSVEAPRLWLLCLPILSLNKQTKKIIFFHDFYCGEILGICFSRFPDLRSISALLFTCSNIPNKLGLRSAPTAWRGPRSGRWSVCRPRFPGTAEVVCARCPVTRDREPLFGGLLREDAPLPGLKRRLGDTCIGSGQVA